MAITCKVALSVGLILFCGAVSQCQGEVERCDKICNFGSLREQCERCRLRVPMRFGKRSSPPEEALLETADTETPEFLRQLNAVDGFSSQFLEYLAQSLQRRSLGQNGGRRSGREEDFSEDKRRADVRVNDWSDNSMVMIRKKRSLQEGGRLLRTIIAGSRRPLAKPNEI